MKPNVGPLDRTLRAALGLGLIYLAFFSGLPIFAEPLVRYGAVATGAIMLAVAAVRVCPIYAIFGLKTCRA